MPRISLRSWALTAGAWLALGILGLEVHGAMLRTGRPLLGERNLPVPAWCAESSRAADAIVQRQTATGDDDVPRRAAVVQHNRPIGSIPGLVGGAAADQQRGRTRTITNRNPREE